jgi:protein TonB
VAKVPLGIAPAAPQESETKPGETKPAEPKPAETKQAETKAPETKLEATPPEPTPEPPQTVTAQPVPVEPPPPAPPEKQLEQALPPVEAPAAPLTMRDFVKAAPAPPSPPPAVARPTPQATPQPSPLQHSPLSTAPTARPPQQQAAASVSSFINPADVAARNRVFDNYRWVVAARISEHRVLAAVAANEGAGSLVMRVSISRDGRLTDATITRSSGSVKLDSAALEAARAASPYAAIPAEIAGNPVSFDLPMGYQRMR